MIAVSEASTRIVDLRSDTVTKPSPEMRRAMADAEVGDDVFGDDPTVNRLQEEVARTLGKETAIFMPSGSMANQTAIRAQTQPGDEIIAHAESHIYHYEAGAPAGLSGCSLRLLAGPRGQHDAAAVRVAVRPTDSHFPQSALIVIENTHNRGGGSVWSVDAIAQIRAVADEFGLRMHLDGARLMNACVASARAIVGRRASAIERADFGIDRFLSGDDDQECRFAHVASRCPSMVD